MKIFLRNNFKTFGNLFQVYEDLYSEVERLYESSVPNEFRLFNIRMKLAFAVTIDFDGELYPTEPRATYKRIFKLTEAWFAYEALLKVCKIEKLAKQKAAKADSLTQAALKEFHIDSLLALFHSGLEREILNDKNTKKDFIGYLIHLRDFSQGRQTALLEASIEKADKSSELHFSEVLSIIYAIRNMHVHNADTAKAGVMRYATKIKLLSNCYDFLALASLTIGIKLLEKLKKKVQ